MKIAVLTCLSAALVTLIVGASARIVPAPDSPSATPAPAKTRPAVAKSVPAAPAYAGLTCRKSPVGEGGGMVAFDSALAISRRGARAIPLMGGRTLYHLTTPDTLRQLTIRNPGCSPWEMVGREGVLREGVAEGAFVSFDAVTERVVGVAVYQWNRATEREPQIWRSGDVLILRGRFLAVADAHQGRRIVQRNASEVRLNAATGSVIATR